MNQITPPTRSTAEARQSDVEARPEAETSPDPRLHQARRRTARRLGAGVVLAIAAMVGCGAWIHIARHAAAADALRVRENAVPVVRTMEVKTVPGARTIDLPGTMQAFDAATLFARATGYIAERNVDIGSHVHKGDVLVRIAAPDLDQQLAQARAQLAQMVAALGQAKAGKSLAEVTNRRTSTLVQEGWTSRQQGDTQQSNLTSQSAGVRVAQANILAQLAQVNRLVELTGFERVTAPFDGVITSRAVDVGTLVTADMASGTPMFSIARTDMLRVQVYVPQEYFFGLKDGQDATITVPQLPGRVFHGRVARNAAALADNTRTLLAEVDVANPDNTLSPGLYGIVHLQQPEQTPVVIIPSEAVIFDKNGLSAAVLQDGHAVLHPLNVLEDDGAQLQIRAGLAPGDRVILNPPANLQPGMRVRTS